MKKQVNISIGELYASKEPVVIHTVLGSCIAVCLFDMENRIGGMNHILLPGRQNLKRSNSPARFGANAMEMLIKRIISLGGNHFQTVAKVFGGAHIMQAISYENSVGRKIGESVKDFLKKEGIKILCQDLEGTEARKVYFHTDTGEVFMKRILAMNYSVEGGPGIRR
jgi:chemotaxis protein CheD